MNNVLKIVRINAFIQSLHDTVLLDGRSVLCVTLDDTITFAESVDGNDGRLTDEQVSDPG